MKNVLKSKNIEADYRLAVIERQWKLPLWDNDGFQYEKKVFHGFNE